MNLREFREYFRDNSGRYDLVDSVGDDTGANVIINIAQKYLDRQVDIPQGIGRLFKDISQGEWLVTFEFTRSILEVWSIGPDSSGKMVRLPLTKRTQNELRGIDKRTLSSMYTSLSTGITQSRPLFYSPAQLRLVTDREGESGGITGMMDVMSDGHQTYNGIVMMPPSDGSYSIEVVGNFYNMPLMNDLDHSFWTDEHPNILYMSVLRQLEIIHRNAEGRKEWDDAIQNELMTIDMDGVAESCSDINEMEG